MRRVINVNIFPSGGYFFRDSDGSVHRAGSWRRVIQKVTEYRARNRLPMGNPEAETYAQACLRQPAICGGLQTQVAVVKPAIPFKAKVLQWLSGFVQLQTRSPLKYVSDAEAKQRANVCAVCPGNTSLGVESCGSCKQSIQSYQSTLLGNARRRDSRLGGCKFLNSELQTAVHLDEVRVDNPSLPRHCWRRTAI